MAGGCSSGLQCEALRVLLQEREIILNQAGEHGEELTQVLRWVGWRVWAE